MKLGIIGLPNVGKSTLFNAITNAGAQNENYPFCTIDPNVGVVPVPDHRLTDLMTLYQTKRTVPATIEFIDIAGLVRGASKGEGLGNKFLSHIREVHALVHVVRCFESNNIVHVEGDVNPARDIDIIETELVFSDVALIERRIERTERAAKSGDKEMIAQLELLKELLAFLSEGNNARSFEAASDADKAFIEELTLLSAKPVIYVANLSEDDILEGTERNPYYPIVQDIAKKEGAGHVAICAKIERDIVALEPEERTAFLKELGLKLSGLDQLIQQSYALLGYISFITAGEIEVRAWTIVKGTTAPKAASKIHSDIERGFIRAEVIPYEQLMKYGSIAAARDKGLVRSEGKDYVVKDGDVIHFRFNV